MHGHHARVGEQIVQQGKDGFLILARIGGVGDQDQLAVKVQRDHGFAAATVAGRISLEGGAVEHCPRGRKTVQLFPLGAAQQVADEQPVPRQFRHHAQINAVGRVGAGVKILHKIIAALHMGQHIGVKLIKSGGRHGGVVFPPDRPFDRRGSHHELVFR